MNWKYGWRKHMEKVYSNIFTASSIGACIIQNKQIRLANPAALRLLEYSFTDLMGTFLEKVVAQADYPVIIRHESLRLERENAPWELDFTLISRTNAPIDVKGFFSLIDFKKQPATLLQFIDISEKKQLEKRIVYLSRADTLTALYNRTFFEKELERLKRNKTLFALIICDLDGLKLVNDTMGLRCGDQIIISTASAIRETFSEALTFRIGGDEFAIIVDNPDETAIKNAIRSLQKTVAVSNRAITQIPITLSCGYAISEDCLAEPEKVYVEADNYMLKKKLFHSQSNHSSVIQILSKALEARDFITEGHAERLHSLVLKLAAKVGLSELRQTNLRLYAQFHDIGKVGIPDNILFKNGDLTLEEKELMKRHAEIGFRIAQAAPDLAHIADWILKHHEWWNGRGYPLGISGEAIPLECRILSIVDAFDAMTHDRPYRKALPVEVALAELQKFAGVQFDPELVKSFIRLFTKSKTMKAEAG
jgi:diguanylate cyclase (GGDEF)-like protein/PAS domain S-box-containing protein